jgi:hypothetical protein
MPATRCRMTFDVLALEAKTLVEAHEDKIWLCPIDSGCTKPFPHPRGAGRLARYLYARRPCQLSSQARFDLARPRCARAEDFVPAPAVVRVPAAGTYHSASVGVGRPHGARPKAVWVVAGHHEKAAHHAHTAAGHATHARDHVGRS